MEEILKNGALHCRFLLMFALFDPPPAPFPAPSWSQAGPGRNLLMFAVFDPPPANLAHVRTFRPPASPISGPGLVPGRPRPELGNVYFPRGCARPRAHTRARGYVGWG